MWTKQLVKQLACLGCLCLVGAAIVPVEESKDNEAQPASDTNSTLELLHVLMRHGPRTPANTFPKDPNLNETFAPYGWGQLTNEAKLELYKIGLQLRKRYKELLGPYYKTETLHAEATESSRTLMSLQLVLAGLLPPAHTPMEWNPKLNWQPVPIYMVPEAVDKRLRQKVPCPRYDEAVWEVMHQPDVLALHEENAAMLQHLTELTGLNISYAHDVLNVFITLQTEQNFGLKLPEWSKEYFPDKMRPLAEKTYSYDAQTPELRKLKGGYYLEDMFKQMQAKIAGQLQPAGRRINIACAHDWSISNVLSALNVWQTQMPRFSALIAIELRRRSDTGEHYVEIYFQNGADQPFQRLQVPGCAYQCPLGQLMELLKDVLPDAPYEQLCLAKGSEPITPITYH